MIGELEEGASQWLGCQKGGSEFFVVLLLSCHRHEPLSFGSGTKLWPPFNQHPILSGPLR